MVVPAWFWELGGFSLVLLGVLQLKSRPPSAHEKSALQRWLSAGVLWALICMVVGALLVLFGMGLVRLPNMSPKEKPAHRLRH